MTNSRIFDIAVAVVIGLCLGNIAGAAVDTTERAGIVELRRRDGAMITCPDQKTPGATFSATMCTFPSLTACKLWIPAPVGPEKEEWTCKVVEHIDKLGNCDDLPLPAPPVASDGFAILPDLQTHECPNAADPALYFETWERDAYPRCRVLARYYTAPCGAVFEPQPVDDGTGDDVTPPERRDPQGAGIPSAYPEDFPNDKLPRAPGEEPAP